MLIDLQLHSTYSDGYLTPTELAAFCARADVKIAALTDHNTVAGLEEFRNACKKQGIKTVNGVEIYTKTNGRRFNVLWYNFNDSDPELHELLRQSQIRRRAQVRRILKRLRDNGFKLEVNKILDKYSHYTPLNGVVADFMAVPENAAKAKKETGISKLHEEDIISNYFVDRTTNALRESNTDFARIVRLRKKIGGQLILCHPAKHHYINRDFWRGLKTIGLDGVEILSPHHSYNAIMLIQRLAREFDFIETGGSDFHRFEGNTYPIQHAWQYYRIDSEYLRKINKIIG